MYNCYLRVFLLVVKSAATVSGNKNVRCKHTLVGLPQAGSSRVDYLSCPLDVRHQQSQTLRLWIRAICLHYTFTLVFL